MGDWIWYCRGEDFFGLFQWANCGYHWVPFIGGKWWF